MSQGIEVTDRLLDIIKQTFDIRQDSTDNYITLEQYKLYEKIWNLRCEGLTHPLIAATLGISELISHHGVRWWAKHGTIEDTTDGISPEDVRRSLSLTRLDNMYASLRKARESGDIKAIETSLKIDESARKLLGLDSPAKVTASLTTYNYQVNDIVVEQLK